MTRVWFTTVLVVAAIGAAACGGSSTNSTSSNASSTANSVAAGVIGQIKKAVNQTLPNRFNVTNVSSSGTAVTIGTNLGDSSYGKTLAGKMCSAAKQASAGFGTFTIQGSSNMVLAHC